MYTCLLDRKRAATGEIPRTRTNPNWPGHGDKSTEDEPQPGGISSPILLEAPLGCQGANGRTQWIEANTEKTPGDGGAHQDISFKEQHRDENHMVEDFDDGANALWSLYGKEAKGHDEATIQTIKDDMDGVLIFVCSYSFTHLGVLSC